MSDRIAVMSQGRVEQIGTPEEIYHQPASVFVAGFIGSANLMPGTVASLADGTAMVTLSAGVTVSARIASPGFVTGGPATVMLRPERLHLSQDEPGGDHLKVRVTDLIFQGPAVRTVVQTADKTELVAHVTGDADLPFLRPGDDLWLSWGEGAAYALPEATEIVGATDTDIDEVEASL